MIAIMDYGVGNLRSVENAFAYIGVDTVITNDSRVIKDSAGIILPGVGAFVDAMGNLKKSGIHTHVFEAVEKKVPLLGICVGMQMMFESSDETDETITGYSNGDSVPGLSVFTGSVTRFRENKDLKIPQIGWNSLQVTPGSRLLQGIRDGSYFYFVHSYHAWECVPEEVAAWTEYGETYPSAIERGNIFCTQFHPEKSGEAGLQVLKNFSEIVNGKR